MKTAKSEPGGAFPAAFWSFRSVLRAHSPVLRPPFRLNRCSWTLQLKPALGVPGESPHHPRRPLAPALWESSGVCFYECAKAHFSTPPHMNLQPPPASLHPMCFLTMEGLWSPGGRSAELQSAHTHTQTHTATHNPPGCAAVRESGTQHQRLETDDERGANVTEEAGRRSAENLRRV